MMLWIAIAVLGVVLSALGLLVFVGRYRRGQVSGRFLLALVVGTLALVAYAVASALRPEMGHLWPAVLILLPAFAAVVVLVNERRRTAK
jgi:drug/metabolite transporter (DMT)-like permease